jgi:Na+-transporting NADH:ubiquinone oxidoreductase subunit C
MAELLSPIRRFFARSNDDLVKIIGMAVLVALVSSAAVSVAAVMLRPYQEANRAAERQARIDQMLDTLPGMRDLMMESGVDTLETRLVNLDDGSFASGADPAGFDLEAALQDPAASIALDPEADIAGIKRRANQSPVYLLQKDGDLKLIVLPVYGAGYQSTIRAALAIEADLVTVAALAIIEQGDTPGFGARIEEPNGLRSGPARRLPMRPGPSGSNSCAAGLRHPTRLTGFRAPRAPATGSPTCCGSGWETRDLARS